MDKNVCLKCEHHEVRKAHGDWLYVACVCKPYEGAWVKNIDCPKEKNERKIENDQRTESKTH